MRRLLAVLAAVAMVGAAWWIRSSFIDGGGGSGGGGTDGELALVCGQDLADVCTALARDDDSIRQRLVPEGTTADALSLDGATADFDAWLTVGPWAEIVQDNRDVAGADGANPLGTTSKVLGRTPVAFVGPNDRIEALEQHCGGAVTWVCVGDVSGQAWSSIGGDPGWGPFKAGLATPSSGAGLVALDQAVAAKAGRPDWDSLDLDESSQWLDQLITTSTVAADPLNLLLTRPGSFSIAAPLLQQAGPRLTKAANGSQFSTLYPEPVVTADVTLTVAAGRDLDEILDRVGKDRLATALADRGWQDTGRPPADGARGEPELPKGDELASPGALQALRDLWRELRP